MKHLPFGKLVIALLATGLLAACGQRGPLSLPERPAPLPKPDGYEERSRATGTTQQNGSSQ